MTCRASGGLGTGPGIAHRKPLPLSFLCFLQANDAGKVTLSGRRQQGAGWAWPAASGTEQAAPCRRTEHVGERAHRLRQRTTPSTTWPRTRQQPMFREMPPTRSRFYFLSILFSAPNFLQLCFALLRTGGGLDTHPASQPCPAGKRRQRPRGWGPRGVRSTCDPPARVRPGAAPAHPRHV